MPDIQPIHIGLLILVIFAGAAWYTFRKNKAGDDKAKEVLKHGALEPRAPQPVPNVVEKDEPEVPTLSVDDQNADIKPVTAEESKPAVVAVPAESETAVDDDFNVDFSRMGRRNTDVDSAVEAVAYFTNHPGLEFSRQMLTRLGRMVEENGLSGRVRFDFFDEVTGLWHHDLDNVERCTQIYMAMLLANRTRSIDDITASKFISLANNISIYLDAEVSVPDSKAMVEGADRVSRIVKAFDNVLSVKIVSDKDINETVLESAAVACGFVKHEGQYEKAAADGMDPIFVLVPSKTLKNEVELKFDVPLMSAADDPLPAFFSLANDLCCRIDAMTTDASGHPLGSVSAAMIDEQLREVHSAMTAHGVPVGSSRALKIFSFA